MTRRVGPRLSATLSILIALGLCSAAGASPPARSAETLTRTFTLELGRESFTPTGIVLQAGSPASVTVTGNGKCGAGNDCPAGASGGNGQTCANRKLGALTPGQAGPNVPYGSVAARVGSGPAFVAGPSSKASGSGELQLIYADCKGYYSDNTGSYSVTVTYSSSSKEKLPAIGSSFTAVLCTISTVAPGSSTCTAQVAGYGSSSLISPTGRVSFTATSGTVGSSCTLTATPGSPGISSCAVSYVPAPTLRAESPPPVTAHYSGDSHFAPSAGVASFTPVSVVLFEGLSVGEVSAVSEGSVEGIPVALTNTNPFAVSADEELTVSGYPPVANSGSLMASAAKTQTIGRATVKLAPLKTVKTKVRLSHGGRRLLKKHKRLKAVLVVRTKRAGKPAKVTRHKLTIKV